MSMLPSCKEVSELLSQAQDRPLGAREKLIVYIHLPLCEGCRHFREQLRFMRRAIREYMRRD